MALTAIQKTFYALFAIGAIVLLSISAMGALSFKFQDASRWTQHTHEVIEALKDSLSALQDVETGNRGFAATGQAMFLDPYTAGSRQVWQSLEKVAELTSDNPVQQKNIEVARVLARDKVMFGKKVVESPVETARKIVATAEGKRIMDRYRAQLKVMIGIELTLLDARSRALKQVQDLIWIVITVLTVSAILLLLWVFKITRDAITLEKQNVLQLNFLNTGLQREISHRQEAERALQISAAQLKSSNMDLQQFAYVASHDLQEPLRAVTGFLTLLSKKHAGTFDQESETWITHAVEGSQRMKTLITDLLSYARIESRGKDLVEFKVADAVKQAETDLSVLIEETRAKINIAESLPTVRGDMGQLAQVFQNLIGNAIKFRGENNPIIDINVEKQDKEWLFSVKDHGIGFEQEHADRIFVIFQRLHGREEYKGTGIGLALCRKIIERHGGRIWAESAKGHGSTFFFTIPAL